MVQASHGGLETMLLLSFNKCANCVIPALRCRILKSRFRRRHLIVDLMFSKTGAKF